MSVDSRISIRNLKHMASLSEETHCFSATLYFDGHPVCVAKNSGHGGPDFHEPLKGDTGSDMAAKLKPVNDYLATLPPEPKYGLAIDLEMITCDLVNEALIQKKVKTMLRKEILFVTKQLEGVRGLKINAAKGHTAEKIRAHLAEKYSDVEILNDMPLERAAKLLSGES